MWPDVAFFATVLSCLFSTNKGLYIFSTQTRCMNCELWEHICGKQIRSQVVGRMLGSPEPRVDFRSFLAGQVCREWIDMQAGATEVPPTISVLTSQTGGSQCKPVISAFSLGYLHHYASFRALPCFVVSHCYLSRPTARAAYVIVTSLCVFLTCMLPTQ